MIYVLSLYVFEKLFHGRSFVTKSLRDCKFVTVAKRGQFVIMVNRVCDCVMTHVMSFTGLMLPIKDNKFLAHYIVNNNLIYVIRHDRRLHSNELPIY